MNYIGKKWIRAVWMLLLTVLLLTGWQAQAALKPDWDDPDFVKRYGTARTSGEDEVDDIQASRITPSKYVTDSVANKYTGLKYQHSSRFKDYDIAYGIDVSKWNKNIDWQKVKADGIEFAFLRIGYSRLSTGAFNKDEYYDVNLKGIKEAKIPFGIYYFSQAITVQEAKDEAQYVLKLLRNEKLDLPVVFDSEDTEGGRLAATDLSRSEYTAINVAFCEVIEQAGYKAMIYNGYYGFNRDLNTAELEDKYEFWFARYNTNTYYDGKYSYWQYSEKGKVKGISGSVDVNFWYRPKGTPVPVPEDPAPQVQGVSAAVESSSQISLSWNSLEGAVNYQVWRAPAYDGEYENVGVTAGTETAFTDSELLPGREYYYQIRGIYADVSYSSFSEIASATTTREQPRQILTTQAVNLKEHAGANYETLGEIPEGTLLTVLSITRNVDENVWYRVSAAVETEVTMEEGTGTESGSDQPAQPGENTPGESAAEPGENTPGESAAESGENTPGESAADPMAEIPEGEAVDQVTDKALVEVTGYISSRQADVYIGQVTGLKQSKKATTSLTIKWKALEDVDGYYVYRSKARNGEYERIAAVPAGTTKYKDIVLDRYTQYYYRVCGFVKVVDAIQDKVQEKIDTGTISSILMAKTKVTKLQKTVQKAVVMRKYAGTTYKKIKKLPKNTVFTMDFQTVDKDGKLWFHGKAKVKNKTYTGYVPAENLK